MKVLMIIDMQNDFVTGSLANPDAQAIIPAIRAKMDTYLKRGDTLIFTRDTHFKNYLNTQEGKHLPVEHCIEHTTGWDIVPELAMDEAKNIHIIDKCQFGYDNWKRQYNLFGISSMENYVERLGLGLEIELVGTCTDICVVSNALGLKAAYPESVITVDASCCAGLTPEKHRAALEVMKSCQIEVINE